MSSTHTHTFTQANIGMRQKQEGKEEEHGIQELDWSDEDSMTETEIEKAKENG